MARRKKSGTNAKPDQETVGVTGDNTVQDAPKGDSVVVQENKDGEATHGTTLEGNTEPVKNTDKIPQNGVTEVETLDVTDNEVAKQSDDDRTEEEVKFADESNPNQKGRTTSAGGAEFDQDGNQRTDGYSYGVAPDDLRGVTDESFATNVGDAPEKADPKTKFDNVRVFTAESKQADTTNTEDTNVELTPEEVTSLEEELSQPDDAVVARVVSSTGSFYKIKFFRNNKPFVTYKARTNKLDKKEVKAFVKAALKVEQ